MKRFVAVLALVLAVCAWDSLGQREKRKKGQTVWTEPISDDSIHSFFVPSSGTTYFNLVDEGPRINDGDFFSGDFGLGPGGDLVAIFGFQYPSHYSAALYSDGTTGVRFGVALGSGDGTSSEQNVAVLAQLAISSAAAGTTVSAAARRTGVLATPSVPFAATEITNIYPYFRPYLFEFNRGDPFGSSSGEAWTVANLLATTFGIQVTTAPIAGLLYVSNVQLRFAETSNTGESRARLRQARGEPAFFCAICSLPFPRSQLINVVDADHPHYGRLVCEADYDDYYQPDEPPAVVEGDIDHERR